MSGIIKQFDECSGLIDISSGYGDVSRVDRDRLISLLQRIPAGDLILSTIPHQEGSRAVIVRPDRGSPRVWHILAPTVPTEPSLLDRVTRRIRT